MPAIILLIWEGLADVLALAWSYAARFLLYMAGATGLKDLVGILWIWIQRFWTQKIFDDIYAMVIVGAGLAIWATFLGVFWTWIFGNGLAAIFSTNPLSLAPATVLYLASNIFPLKFMFGLSIAYLQWKFTYIEAAIVLNRLAKAFVGF